MSTFCWHPCVSSSGYINKISQMPVVLIPVHFDRDPLLHSPSCQHSVVIRTFITSDFMTGIAAEPGNHLPEEVCISKWLCKARSFISSGHSNGLVGSAFCCRPSCLGLNPTVSHVCGMFHLWDVVSLTSCLMAICPKCDQCWNKYPHSVVKF